MTVFGKEYAKAYDSLYQTKDYEKECEFIEAIFSKSPLRIRRILDLGCGTGGHALLLAKRGYEVVGIDRSAEMLELARQRAEKEGLSIKFIQGDVTQIDLNEKFDAVISMFAVMGYQILNDDLAAACRTAKKHLVPEGVFIFDCWNGPAVLMDNPVKCEKEINLGNNEKIVRFTNPLLDTFNHTVEVNFKVRRIKDDIVVNETHESHFMRYIFPQEIKYFLKSAGFSDVQFHPFLKLEDKLSDKDWNMSVIAKLSQKVNKQNNNYEEIRYNDQLLAIILRADYKSNKTVFFGSPDFSQQLGYIAYEKDGVIKAHFHKEAHRKIILTQEVLFIRKGSLTVNFYTTEKEYITSRNLETGDVIFLCSGGHGFKMLEDTEMIEVKQGPYSGRDSDKEIFEGIENDTGK